MDFLTPETLQISAITVVFLYFIGQLFNLIKNWLNKNSGINNDKLELFERLTAVETSLKDLKERFDNHIHVIYNKLDEVKNLFVNFKNKYK